MGAFSLLVVWSLAALPADAPVLLAQAPRIAEIDQATRQVDDGDFEDAIRTLNRGLAEPDLTDDQLAELYRLLGLSNLYLGKEEGARDAFEKLLQARPDYEVPRSSPPKVAKMYARIKEDIKKRRVRPVTISLDALPNSPGGQPVIVQTRIEDLSLGAKARFFYRRAGAQSFSSIDFSREKGTRDGFTATVPAFEVPAEDQAWELEYYLEVFDAAQRRLAGRGDVYSPLSFKVLPKGQAATAAAADRPWYKNPWVWVGVGVGAAAIATGAVVLATQKQTGTLPITIRIEGQP